MSTKVKRTCNNTVRKKQKNAGPAHYLANIMNHRYQRKNLDDAQKDAAYTYTSATPVNPELVPYVVHLILILFLMLLDFNVRTSF